MRTKYWYWIWKTFLGPSRLRRKFVRTFLFAGLVPLVLMGAVSVYLVNLTHRVDVTALEQNLARQVANEIKKITDETFAKLELTVTFPQFAPIAFSQQGFILEDILREIPSLRELSFVCLTPLHCRVGEETSRFIRRENGALESAAAATLRAQEPGFLPATEGKNYFGPVVFGADGLSSQISSPVFNKNRQVIAVLLGTFELTPIQEIAAVSKLGETGYVYVAAIDGIIIAHTNPEQIGKNAGRLPPVASFIPNGEEIKKQESPVYNNLAGIPVSGAGSLIESFGWVAVAEWPRAETQQLIQTILWQIGGFFLLGLIVIAGMASLVAFKLIQPIAELRQGTSVIGAGNFNYRVRIKTGDELEDLGTNLNKMAENLKGLEEVRELRLRAELLSESLKKEQELSKLKDQFITTVSHQFNTPLAAINWALSAFKEPKLSRKKIDETARVIAKSQRDILSIVNDLMTLSDIGFRYKKKNVKPVDLAALVEKNLEHFNELVRFKKLNVQFERKTEHTMAKMNEFNMEKAIGNFIDNAIAYSNEGGTIQIKLDGDKNQLTLQIADQGIGIPKEDQPSIFQQFFRAKNAVAKKNVGTGLGLFIAKTIIEGHGGRITFTSEENKGSTFLVTIPR